MNAKMVCVWSNEQAMREIYLKPFEICVKDGDAHAVMYPGALSVSNGQERTAILSTLCSATSVDLKDLH